MHPLGQYAGGGADRAHLIEVAAIDALAVLDDLGAHQLLGEALVAVGQGLAVAAHRQLHRVVVGQGGDFLLHPGLDCIELFVALGLGLGELHEHFADAAGTFLLQEVGQGGVDDLGLGEHLLDAELLEQILLGLDQFTDGFIAEVDRFDHILLGELVGTCFHHDHPLGGAGHHQIQLAALDLAEAGVEHEVVTQQADPHRGHRALEGDAGQQGGQGGAGHGQHIGRHPLVEGEAGGHDLDVVPHPAGEQGPHRPIDQAAGEDRPFGGARFAPEEAARDATGGVEPLFVVAHQGEEIDAFAAS